jgi:hypothetical protein
MPLEPDNPGLLDGQPQIFTDDAVQRMEKSLSAFARKK